MTGILLSLLLLLMGAPEIENADEVTVVFTTLEDGHLGAACDSAFRGIPGNIQDLYCNGYEDGTVLIDSAQVRAQAGGSDARFRYLMLATLAHEAKHIELGPDLGAADPFQEAACYRAGAVYAAQDFNARSSAVRTVLMGDK